MLAAGVSRPDRLRAVATGRCPGLAGCPGDRGVGPTHPQPPASSAVQPVLARASCATSKTGDRRLPPVSIGFPAGRLLSCCPRPSPRRRAPAWNRPYPGQDRLAATASGDAQALLDRAWYYLLAHGGLRLGELVDLHLSDCDLAQRRLRIREGKGDRDRIVYLSEPAVQALRAYLAVREPAASDHLLIQRGRPLGRAAVQYRLKRYGQAVGLPVLARGRASPPIASHAGAPVRASGQYVIGRDLSSGTGLLTLAVQSAKPLWAGQLPGNMSES